MIQNYHILLLLHAIPLTGLPHYLAESLFFSLNVNSTNTWRGASLLLIPNNRTVIFNQTFMVTAYRFWVVLNPRVV